MSQVPLAPPPQTGGPIDNWLYLLWRRITQEAQILWSSIAPATSAEIAATVTDETGTAGNLVFSGNPTLQGLNVTTAAFTSRGITDNATATALTIDSSGRIGIGATPEVSHTLELSSNAGGGPNIAMKKTVAAITDNSMFAFAGYAYNTSALALGGTINFKASENWTTTANGTYIQFRTVKAGTTTLSECARMWDNGAFSVARTISTGGYTVATLPAGTVGQRAYVTDALAPAYGVAVAGAGAVTIPVFYNGAAWICA